MVNIVQRNLQRSLAKTISVMEEETGLSQNQLVEILNEEYGYVSPTDPVRVADLNKQIELDKAADRHANKKNIQVNKIAVVKTILDRETGKLAKNFKKSNTEREQN